MFKCLLSTFDLIFISFWCWPVFKNQTSILIMTARLLILTLRRNFELYTLLGQAVPLAFLEKHWWRSNNKTAVLKPWVMNKLVPRRSDTTCPSRSHQPRICCNSRPHPFDSWMPGCCYMIHTIWPIPWALWLLLHYKPASICHVCSPLPPNHLIPITRMSFQLCKRLRLTSMSCTSLLLRSRLTYSPPLLLCDEEQGGWRLKQRTMMMEDVWRSESDKRKILTGT